MEFSPPPWHFILLRSKQYHMIWIYTKKSHMISFSGMKDLYSPMHGIVPFQLSYNNSYIKFHLHKQWRHIVLVTYCMLKTFISMVHSTQAITRLFITWLLLAFYVHKCLFITYERPVHNSTYFSTLLMYNYCFRLRSECTLSMMSVITWVILREWRKNQKNQVPILELHSAHSVKC